MSYSKKFYDDFKAQMSMIGVSIKEEVDKLNSKNIRLDKDLHKKIENIISILANIEINKNTNIEILKK